MRLVDADALKAKSFGKRGGLIHTSDIDAMPTVDAVPVRHGRWIPKFNGAFKGGAYWFECSNCRRTVPGGLQSGYNFCPECGERKDGGT